MPTQTHTHTHVHMLIWRGGWVGSQTPDTSVVSVRGGVGPGAGVHGHNDLHQHHAR
jgi:hypothetical protein